MALNFDSINVEVADLPEVPGRGGGGRPAKDNPFTPMLSESFADGRGRGITVERKDVKEAVYLLRRAAQSIEIGVRIVLTDAKGNVVAPADIENLSERQKVRVLFQGKEKRKLTRKPKTQTDSGNSVSDDTHLAEPSEQPAA